MGSQIQQQTEAVFVVCHSININASCNILVSAPIFRHVPAVLRRRANGQLQPLANNHGNRSKRDARLPWRQGLRHSESFDCIVEESCGRGSLSRTKSGHLSFLNIVPFSGTANVMRVGCEFWERGDIMQSNKV